MDLGRGAGEIEARLTHSSLTCRRGPGILPGAKWSHMISRLNANTRLSSGCLRLVWDGPLARHTHPGNRNEFAPERHFGMRFMEDRPSPPLIIAGGRRHRIAADGYGWRRAWPPHGPRRYGVRWEAQRHTALAGDGPLPPTGLADLTSAACRPPGGMCERP